jgi:hypothetical protein
MDRPEGKIGCAGVPLIDANPLLNFHVPSAPPAMNLVDLQLNGIGLSCHHRKSRSIPALPFSSSSDQLSALLVELLE